MAGQVLSLPDWGGQVMQSSRSVCFNTDWETKLMKIIFIIIITFIVLLYSSPAW
ncbi:TPA: hypothetical protein ACPSEP_000450 [Haemophilus influenzae]